MSDLDCPTTDPA